MNTLQINKILTRNYITRNVYIGCFPSDQIPTVKVKFPHCICINTGSSHSAGEHWIGVWVESPMMVELYDSLAEWPPHANGIIEFLEKFPRIKHLPSGLNLQHPHTATCGAHVCVFFYLRALGYTFNQIVAMLFNIMHQATRRNTAVLKNSQQTGRADIDRYVCEFLRKYIFKS